MCFAVLFCTHTTTKYMTWHLWLSCIVVFEHENSEVKNHFFTINDSNTYKSFRLCNPNRIKTNNTLT